MKKENFKKLLTDLYGVFNQKNIATIHKIAEESINDVNRAVNVIIFKYNNGKNYDQKFDDSKYIQEIISSYENDNFILENYKKENPNADSLKEDKKTLDRTVQYEYIFEDSSKENMSISSYDAKDIVKGGVGSHVIIYNDEQKPIKLKINNIVTDLVTDKNKVMITIFFI